jgi:hypothetical protein
MDRLRFLLVGLVVGCSADESEPCGLAGCTDSPVAVTASLPRAPGELVGSRIAFCASDECSETMPGTNSGEDVLFARFEGDANPSRALVTTEGSRLLHSVFLAKGRPEVENLRLDVVGPDGASLYTKESRASLRFYPNGEKCDKPQNVYCTGGAVDM